jgi:hypothetical protein
MSTASQTGQDGPVSTFDPGVAHPARVYNYWLPIILSFCVGRGL